MIWPRSSRARSPRGWSGRSRSPRATPGSGLATSSGRRPRRAAPTRRTAPGPGCCGQRRGGRRASVSTARRRPPPPTPTPPPGLRRLLEAVQEARAAFGRYVSTAPTWRDDGQGIGGHPRDGVREQFDGVPPKQHRGGAAAANPIAASSMRPAPAAPAHTQARNHRASSGSVTSIGSRSRPIRATTSGAACAGTDRSPTTEQLTCTADDGSPSDRAVAVPDADAVDLEIEPGRAAHVDQPHRRAPAPPCRLGDGRVQHGAASGPTARGRRRTASATTASVCRSSVSIAAPAAASPSAAA